MKDKLLLFVASLILLLYGCSKDNISGSAKISRVHAGGQLQVEYSYDPGGRLINYTVYGMPGKKTSEASFHYDANGRLIKKESAYDFSSSATPQWSYSYTDYTYGPDGRISEEMNYLKQGSIYELRSKAKPVYDGSGKLMSRKLFLPNDDIIRLTTYEYDNKGNIILQEEYKYNNPVPDLEYRYRYDAFDNKLNPYTGMASSVPPHSINRNNILQMTVTNFVVTPGSPVTTINHTVYNSYTQSGLPVKIFENGTNYVYEYK